jgi:uncharacterized protein YjdB
MKITLCRFFLCFAALLMAFTDKVGARVGYIPYSQTSQSVLSNELVGGSWDNPVTLQEAIFFANDSDRLCLGEGLNVGHQYISGASELATGLHIYKSIYIEGGFLGGKSNNSRMSKNWLAGKSESYFPRSFIHALGIKRALTVLGNGTKVRLTDITLIDGDASSEIIAPHCGGGLYVSAGAEVELKRVVVESNRASSDAEPGKGGGIYVDGKLIIKDGRNEAFFDSSFCILVDRASNPPMFNNTVEGSSVSKNVASVNSADGMGGGIYIGKTGNVTIESKGLEVTSSGKVVEASGDGDGWYIGYRGELSVEKGVVFGQNVAVAGNGGSGKGGAIYNEGTLYLRRGSALFENNTAASGLANGSDAYGGAIYFNKLAEGGPVYFSGNRAKPVNAAGKSQGNHVYPYQIVTFVDVDPFLFLSVDGKNAPLAGASYVMTDNSFTFTLKRQGLYGKSSIRVIVNGVRLQELSSSTEDTYNYEIKANNTDNVEEFKVEIKIVHPVHISVAPVLRRTLTLSPAFDENGDVIDSIPHGGTFKFTVTINANAESLADDYFVVVNGRVLDRESSRIKQLAPNKYEYTISDYITTAYTVAIASSVPSVGVTFKAPPAGVFYFIDGEPLDFKGRDLLEIIYFAEYPIYFIVKHDDDLYEPPAVRFNGVEIRRILWEVRDERHFSVTPPAYDGSTISIDIPKVRIKCALNINAIDGAFYVGEQGCLPYSMDPPLPYIVPITCKSSDPSIVEIISVDASARRICVVGKQVGKAFIIGQLALFDKDKEANGSDKYVTDTVEIEVRELSTGQGTVYVIKGSSKQLPLPVRQAEWYTEDPSIVTVTPEGELFGVSGGQATVVCATGEVKWQIWTVYVLDKKNPGEQTVLQENTVYSLREVFGIENIGQWKSSDPLVAFVRNDTLLYTYQYGKTVLSDASAVDGGLGVYVARIELVKDKALTNPVIGTVAHISDTVKPEEIKDKRIVWMTSRVSVAEIVDPGNAGANVKIKASGEAYIQASLKSHPEVKAVAYLSTLSAIEWLSTPPKFLVENEIVTLSATLNPRMPVDDVLVWDTVPGNNGSVVVLDQTGQIKARSLGEGKIRVSSKANPAHYQDITIPVVRVACEAPRTTFAIGDMGSITLQVQGRETGIDTLELVSPRPDVLALSKSSLVVSGERIFLTALSSGIVPLTAQIKGCPNTKATFSLQVVQLELPTKQIVVVMGDSPFSLMPKITPGNLLTWYSTNPLVASVQNHQGVVTPLSVGTTFIVADLYEKEGDDTPVASASCQVTVVGETYANNIIVGAAPEMTGLTIVAPVEVYEMGKSYQLAIEKDGEIITSSPEMTWESGVGENITINPTTGWMTPNVPGPASIKVTCNGIIKTYTFTVVAPSGGIKLNATELTLHENEKRTIGYVLSPSGNAYGTIVWTSSNKAVDVDRSGLVTANYYGEASIKATLYGVDGIVADSAFCKVKVASESVGFALSDSERTLMKKGDSFSLWVEAMPPGIDIGRAYFVSDNPLIAYVSMNGTANAVITANNGGSVNIAVYVQGVPNLVRRCKVTVNSDPEKILLNYDELTLPVGKKVAIAAWVFPVTAPQEYTLTSANQAIAHVAGNEVTALSVGTTKITAQTPNGRITDLTLKVVSPSEGTKKKLTLSDATLVLTRGQRHTILAYSPDNSPVTWSVSGSATAIEHEDGWVRALAPGEATVTATDAQGNTASCKVVVNIFADRLIVYPYRPRILLIGETFTANAVLEPVDVPLNEVVWVADNPAVVDIEQTTALTCRITGMAEGVTLLSAQSADGKVVNQWLLSIQKTRSSAIEQPEELLHPSVSYHAGVLTLNNLAGHRVSLTTLSGRTLSVFAASTNSESCALSLPAGVYILTASRQSARFVTKFVVR